VPATATLSVQSEVPLAPGSVVTVTLPTRYLLLGALLVYGVPLAALLCGGALGALIYGSDLAAALAAALALCAALLAAPLLRRRLERATLSELAVRAVGELPW
jgi:positive regulator of sigma E activity